MKDKTKLPVPGVLACDVMPEQVHWLWPGHIPLGKISIFDGDPGVGKTCVALDIAARITSGQHLPDGSYTQATNTGAVIVSAEDGLADTFRPRLEAAGAELGRVRLIENIRSVDGLTHVPTIPSDLPEIRRAIEDVKAGVVVLDPLMAMLGSETNSYREQDVRRALAPLSELAAVTGAAIILIRHLSKSGGVNAKYRGGGSIGIIGAARASFVFGENPEEPKTLVMAANKLNLCAPPPSLKYTLVERNSLVVEWQGETSHSASYLLAIAESAEDASASGEAKDFLREALRDGPRASKEIFREAREIGISDKTLRRAQTSLGVKARKRGMEQGWEWVLPVCAPKMAKTDEDAHQEKLTTFAENGHLREEAAENERRCFPKCEGMPEMAKS